MKVLSYKSSTGISKVYIACDWSMVNELINPDKTVIITDSNISKIYGEKFPKSNIFTILPGEQSKNLKIVESIIKGMLKQEIDREWFMLGIGGGVVCDICGFIASIYMRGINFGYVSSSLLSQLDASTGGKTGVNSSTYKNIIGTFNQPQFVICDQSMLSTLPEVEFVAGLGELVKHALIKDRNLFEDIETNSASINANNQNLLQDYVKKSVAIKISIVEKDEKEHGLRRLLNFAHTFGHAIESVTMKKHGFAIAEGIYFASLFSLHKKYINAVDHERIFNLLKQLKLLSSSPKTKVEYIEYIKRDKKRKSELIDFVVLKGIGKAEIEAIKLDELFAWMKDTI